MDGSALRLTVARFYTPSGRCIQKSYENGNEDYFNDLYSRFTHQEQLYSDSIHFNDSLKYYTKSGRTVYGGGGIMPDIFVPLDTTGNSEYFTRIYHRGLIYSFAYIWADNYRETLSKFSSWKEIDEFLEKQKIIESFFEYAADKGIPKDTEGVKVSGEIINTQLKAYIARNIMGEEGFYPIIQQIDNTLIKAIDVSRQNLIVENLAKQ
jgi:carboxyl-terminal processing protease